uniref:Uncharacterized protein n=1 Tax=Brassica oleracea var. oleracea TaxID=109376 RepID=A0A0D3EBG5_BRAOL
MKFSLKGEPESRSTDDYWRFWDTAPYILVKNQAELWFVRGFQIIIARTGLDVRSLLLPKYIGRGENHYQ